MANSAPRHADQTRIMLRPVASGLPLGFYSFGIGMIMLGFSAIGVIPLAETKQVGLTLALFVFPLELIATIFAFLARDATGAATMGLFTTSWLTIGVTSAIGGSKTSVATGIYLFAFATVVALIAWMAINSKPFFTVLLTLACGRMVLDGIYQVGGSHGFYTVSGYLAVALGVLAFYGGTAFALEEAMQKEVLPIFRRGKAAAAFGGYKNQIGRLEAEPGVRQQL